MFTHIVLLNELHIYVHIAAFQPNKMNSWGIFLVYI